MIRTLIIFVFALFLLGCTEEEPVINYFNVDGKDYSLSEAFTIEYGGDATTGYNFDLLIHSSEIEPDIENETFIGEGEYMYFELWSSSVTGLAAGIYTINPNTIPNACTSHVIIINYNSSTQDSDTEYDQATGSVIIAVDGSTYSIDFDLTIGKNETLTGNYTGSLPNYEG